MSVQLVSGQAAFNIDASKIQSACVAQMWAVLVSHLAAPLQAKVQAAVAQVGFAGVFAAVIENPQVMAQVQSAVGLAVNFVATAPAQWQAAGSAICLAALTGGQAAPPAAPSSSPAPPAAPSSSPAPPTAPTASARS